MGIGEPWFDGLEPALARVMMAISWRKSSRVQQGFQSSTMQGSEHNDAWTIQAGQISPLLTPETFLMVPWEEDQLAPPSTW